MLKTVSLFICLLGAASGLRVGQVENYGLSSLYNGLAGEYNSWMFSDPKSKGEVDFTAKKATEEPEVAAPVERSEVDATCSGHMDMATCNQQAACTWQLQEWYVGEKSPKGQCIAESARGQCRADPSASRLPCECMNTSKSCATSTACSWVGGSAGCTTTCHYLYQYPKGFSSRSEWQWSCENHKKCEFCNASATPRCEPVEYCGCMHHDNDKDACMKAEDALGRKLCVWGWGEDNAGCYAQAEVLEGARLLCYDSGIRGDTTICNYVRRLVDAVKPRIKYIVNMAYDILPKSQAEQFERNINQVDKVIVESAKVADKFRRRFTRRQ